MASAIAGHCAAWACSLARCSVKNMSLSTRLLYWGVASSPCALSLSPSSADACAKNQG